MERTSYITSLKYSPGLAKEFSLFGTNVAKKGRVDYLVSKSYGWLLKKANAEIHYLTKSDKVRDAIVDVLLMRWRIVEPIRRIFQKHKPDFILFYNSHPANSIIARIAAEEMPNGTRAVYLHEPYVPDKKSYGRLRTVYIILNEWLQTRALKYINCVIVPSPYAKKLFGIRYPKYKGETKVVPILLSDKRLAEKRPRRYISLIGNLNESRGLEEFIALINYSANRGLSWQFKLVTRAKITKKMRKLSIYGNAILSVVNKRNISDAEIAEAVAESYAVFLPHKQATQSGNIPVCFMQGTPIIARNIPGLSQHIRHKYNGYLLPMNFMESDTSEAVHFIKENIEQLSYNARRDYEKIFDERNWQKYYSWL